MAVQMAPAKTTTKTATLNTVLVAIDRTALSLLELDFLQFLSLRPDSLAVLAHVVSNPLEDSEPADRPHEDSADQYSAIEEQLEILGDRLPCTYDIEIVKGDPADELVRLASIYKSDLIVIGTRGLKGVDRIIKGSVSSQVLETAPCSVLVVKQ